MNWWINRFLKKKKVKELKIGSKIHYLWNKLEWYKLYEWLVLEILEDEKLKVSVMSKNINDSDDFFERIVDKKIVKIDK